MKRELVHSLTDSFESHAYSTDRGVEFWLDRDLQHLLGYAGWRNFNASAVSKAKSACELFGHAVADHFVDVNKMVELDSGTEREGADLTLIHFASRITSDNSASCTSSIAIY